MTFPQKGSALDKALAFSVIVTTLVVAAMLLGFADANILMQLIAAIKG